MWLVANLSVVVFVCSLTVSQATLINDQIFTQTAQPVTQAPALPAKGQDNDFDDFAPYNSSRHDEFDWKLIRAILTSKSTATENVIISPFSVKLVMSLLAEAAGRDTSTQRELAAVLPGLGVGKLLREFYTPILGSLQKHSDDYEFKIGTKIYLDRSVRPTQRYGAIIETYYFTRVESIEFSNTELAAQTINSWVADVTQGEIEKLVASEDLQDAVMVILNAIYFRGLWRRPFPTNESFDAAFYTTPGVHHRTQYMSQTGNFFFLDSQQLDAKVLRMPYKGHKFAMTLVLPNKPETELDQLVQRMNSQSLHRAQFFMDDLEMYVQVPKFKFGHKTEMNEVLESLGITTIFTHEASLPALARGEQVLQKLQVSKILQKAGIAVHEEGSTAFAATEVALTTRFGEEMNHEFIANRPFVFIVEDETTGTLLFVGKVTNPELFEH